MNTIRELLTPLHPSWVNLMNEDHFRADTLSVCLRADGRMCGWTGAVTAAFAVSSAAYGETLHLWWNPDRRGAIVPCEHGGHQYRREGEKWVFRLGGFTDNEITAGPTARRRGIGRRTDANGNVYFESLKTVRRNPIHVRINAFSAARATLNKWNQRQIVREELEREAREKKA